MHRHFRRSGTGSLPAVLLPLRRARHPPSEPRSVPEGPGVSWDASPRRNLAEEAPCSTRTCEVRDVDPPWDGKVNVVPLLPSKTLFVRPDGGTRGIGGSTSGLKGSRTSDPSHRKGPFCRDPHPDDVDRNRVRDRSSPADASRTRFDRASIQATLRTLRVRFPSFHESCTTEGSILRAESA